MIRTPKSAFWLLAIRNGGTITVINFDKDCTFIHKGTTMITQEQIVDAIASAYKDFAEINELQLHPVDYSRFAGTAQGPAGVTVTNVRPVSMFFRGKKISIVSNETCPQGMYRFCNAGAVLGDRTIPSDFTLN